MKEAKIMSIFCSRPNLISEMSLSLSAGKSTLECGKFTPLWDPRAPDKEIELRHGEFAI